MDRVVDMVQLIGIVKGAVGGLVIGYIIGYVRCKFKDRAQKKTCPPVICG